MNEGSRNNRQKTILPCHDNDLQFFKDNGQFSDLIFIFLHTTQGDACHLEKYEVLVKYI